MEFKGMKAFYILMILQLSLVWTACGRKIRITGEFEPYVEKFESESSRFDQAVAVEEVIIELGTLETSKNGVCILKSNEPPKIIIQYSFWKSASQESKEVLLFHELGHCILKREHKEGVHPTSFRPVSIMRSEIVSAQDFLENYDEYLGELFNKK